MPRISSSNQKSSQMAMPDADAGELDDADAASRLEVAQLVEDVVGRQQRSCAARG